MLKKRTLQTCSLKHRIRKTCFFFCFRVNRIYLSQAWVSLPFLPHWLCACLQCDVVIKITELFNDMCFWIIILLFTSKSAQDHQK